MSKDLKLTARHIADSRGRPTVQVEAEVAGVIGIGDVPAGASKGEDEAQTVEIGKAMKNVVERILPTMQLANVDLKNVDHVGRIDGAMIAYAGVNFKDLGANATLPVSRALYALCAKLNDMPLYALLRKAMPKLASDNRVHFFMNIFNGGLHALKTKDKEELGRDRIDIQEIMVVPMRAKTYREAMQAGEKIDAALKALLVKKYGDKAVTRAD
jgi:enolase